MACKHSWTKGRGGPACPYCAREKIAALRARLERAEAECARMTAEYQAWIEELEGPTPAQLLARAERYREALDAARDLERAFSDDDPPALAVTRPEATRRVMLLRVALAATGDEERKGGDRG